MFYASPLTLNPAYAGASEGDYRLAGIYRDQWRSVTKPFQTGAGSFDMRLLKTKLKRDVLGVGASFVWDKAGTAGFQTISGNAFVSFHKSLDKNAKHFLGLGLQFGYNQKSLNANGLIFPSQHIDDNFDPNATNNESSIKPNTSYFDMSAGLLHQSSVGERIGIFTGVTVHHLVMPKESFLGEDYKLKPRIVAHGGVRVKCTKNFYVVPNVLFQYQNKAQEINFGTSLEYRMQMSKTDFIASIGGWYRVSDAAIITAGIGLYGVKLMAAYDINTSKLKPATGGNGGFEIALVYTGFIKTKVSKYPVMVPCPMM